MDFEAVMCDAGLNLSNMQQLHFLVACDGWESTVFSAPKSILIDIIHSNYRNAVIGLSLGEYGQPHNDFLYIM